MVRRPPGVVRLTSKEVRLNVPLGRHEPVVVESKLVTVFEDAANFDVRQREDLCHELDALGLFNEFVVRLSAKRNDGSVGVNGSALDILHVERTSTEVCILKLDVAELFAELVEYLEAD